MCQTMAITRNTAEVSDTELPLVINNGDLVALRSAVDRLGFKDEESLLRYVLAVVAQSATRSMTVIDKEGKSIALKPGESLLKDKSEEADF